MKSFAGQLTPLIAATLLGLTGGAARSQTTTETAQLAEVVVTGSRIAQQGASAQQPVSIIDRAAIDKTNLQSLGDLLQQMTTGGSALNTKFNSSGNAGYPPDGGGIGAGSAQVDLRNLDSKRVLVLVDGIRWVNESSASGVSGSADLNTIPLSVVERIEVLEDGASAIYGSDAIAGVVNVITRKKIDGVEINGYTGEYGKGGRTTDVSLTAGGSSEKFSGMFVASYFNQDSISSSKWWQSAYPQPLAGLAAGSSATPQGRYTFCDPRVTVPNYGSCTPGQENYYDVTLNNGTTTPIWNPADPTSGTYHNWAGSQDAFNYAPYNLLLTPSQRKSMFTNLAYDINDDIEIHVKALFNNRQSANQAAPEPIFVGPYAGTGGIADGVSVAANNPYNPFGITLDPATNFGWVARRPIEGGARVFDQDVNTYYFNVGMNGVLHVAGGFKWDVNAAYSDNKAEQTFTNGYNVGKIKLALGDVNVCLAVPGCVPLDIFGGQNRPMTQAMINYIRATQLDSSDEILQLVSANITGNMFHIGDRAAGFAAGVEHRRYAAAFNPDPLRITGESQDSPAFPVAASYRVSEAYSEFNFPLLASFSTSAAVRYSDYSTFGGDTTGKVGFRWQPLTDLAVRGTYSKGFRAPNLGELYGLTQFAPNLVDPCGPTSGAVVTGPPVTALQKACVAQGVPVGFVQASTQINSFTGGNAALKPEKSASYTVGLQYRASWAENQMTDKLSFETSYYHHKITGAIQAADLQALLNSCLAAGGTDPALCAPFSRQTSGNLNPPKNFLQNFGEITTGGVDVKLDWAGAHTKWGRPTVGVQTTYVSSYKAVDGDGIVSQRQVGVEVNNSAIPRIRLNAQLGWNVGDWQASWIVRYLTSVTEACANAAVTGVPGCETATDFHKLQAIVYNDVQLEWKDAFTLRGLRIALGVNNLFGQNPPICYTCTLNGYDAGTYDLPALSGALEPFISSRALMHRTYNSGATVAALGLGLIYTMIGGTSIGAIAVAGEGAAPAAVDATILARIRDAAMTSNWGWQHLADLTDKIGPRLSGSPQLTAAVAQVADSMRSLHAQVTLQSVKVPHWVRGEEQAELVDYPGIPVGVTQRLHLTTLGASSATPANGLTAHVIVVHDLEELKTRAQDIRGNIVLFESRFDQRLADNGHADDAYEQAALYRFNGPSAAAALGAAAALVRSVGGADFRLPHTGVTQWKDEQAAIPAAALAAEDADLIARLAASGSVTLRLLLTPKILPDADSNNVIADWPGREKPGEYVIVSGHLDSWDLATGATDDGVGVTAAAAVIEILRQLDLHPRRTIRFVAWTNEENGSRGNKAYFASVDNAIETQTAAIESDDGAGRSLGVAAAVTKDSFATLQPVLNALGPIGATAFSRRDGDLGTDIALLQEAGVPGFAPLVDSRHSFDYHHTAADTLDKVDPESLRSQVATMAVLAYFLAELPAPLPRFKISQ